MLLGDPRQADQRTQSFHFNSPQLRHHQSSISRSQCSSAKLLVLHACTNQSSTHSPFSGTNEHTRALESRVLRGREFSEPDASMRGWGNHMHDKLTIFTEREWISADIHEREVNIVLILEKCETKASCRRPCFASAWNCSACTVVRCGRTDLIDLFPAAFVSSQIAQVESPRILERVVPVQVRSAAKSL